MVSAEGACAAYYAYGRHSANKPVQLEQRTSPDSTSPSAEKFVPCNKPVEARSPHRRNLPQKILRKCNESVEMKQKFFCQYAGQIEQMARTWPNVSPQGKRLFVMGNGGSLCDALHFSVEFTHPIIEKRAAFPVIPLMTDIATMTAIGNDVDYSRIYVNQLRVPGHSPVTWRWWSAPAANRRT